MALPEQQAVDIEAFVDDGHIRAEDRPDPVGKRQHFEVSADDDIRPRDALQPGAKCQRRPCHGEEALAESTVARHAEIDRHDAVEIGHDIMTPEACQCHARATGLQHGDTPTGRRVAEIVDQVQNVQH